MAKPAPHAATDLAQADDPRLRRLDRLGYLLDASIRLPGTDYRVGYDAVIGLIPGFGDLAGLALSAYLVFEAARFGVPKATLVRMTFNIALEALVGAVPLLGDVFDAAYKANLRNLALLHDHVGGRPVKTSNKRFVVTAVVVLVVALIVVVVLLVALGIALANALGG